MKVVIYILIGFLLSFRLEAETIKIGSLQYGSVNWELKLIKELEENLKTDDLEKIKKSKENLEKVAQSIAQKAYQKAQKEQEKTKQTGQEEKSDKNKTVDAEFESKD